MSYIVQQVETMNDIETPTRKPRTAKISVKLTEEEKNNLNASKRSSIPLRTALPYIREKLQGVYGSRTLHLFLSYDKIKKKGTKGTSDLVNEWMEFMSKFMVPPVRIYLSKDPSLVDPEELDCDELIKKLNKSGPNVGFEEKVLQEKLYSSPECMEKYFEQFKKDTPATSPELSKKEIEEKSAIADAKGKVLENEYVKILYTQFFNILDTEALIAMIMACLQKALGIEFTAEAICEAAIIQLIKSVGTTPIEQAMLANALLNPSTQSSQDFMNALSQNPLNLNSKKVVNGELVPIESPVVLDDSYRNTPIALSMEMSMTTSEGSGIAKIIKELESSGVAINLVPGQRPQGQSDVTVPFGSGFYDLVGVSDEVEGEYGLHIKPANYTNSEIQKEKERLKRLGYTEAEANAAMVRTGFLRPDVNQYEPLLGGNNHSSHFDRLATELRSGQMEFANSATVEGLRNIG